MNWSVKPLSLFHEKFKVAMNSEHGSGSLIFLGITVLLTTLLKNDQELRISK
jgi:hypothetical protein